MTTTVESTLTLRTPRYYGHPVIADRSQSPSETFKEMTEINSCYYELSLLRKCGKFHTPQRDNSLIFFSHFSGHLSISSKILTHII